MQSKVTTDVEAILTWLNPPREVLGHSDGGRANLKDGERLKFGISSRTGDFQPEAEPSIGAFQVTDDYLLISNYTTGTTYVIENLEGGSELVKIRPRRLRMVVPFEISRVLIPSASDMIEITVFGPSPRLLGKERATSEPEAFLANLDPESKYFAVLVALCEPRLHGSSMAAVPSVQEVVERLKGHDQFRHANRSSINYHIDYLADRKLAVGKWSKYVDDGRMHSKREALVAFALRFDLVREEHLTLLPKPRSSGERGLDVPY